MNVLVRRCAVAVLGVATVAAVVFGGSVLATSGIAPAGGPGPLAQLSLHGPGNGDTETPTGPGVVVAKPAGGATSKAQQSAACRQALEVLNEDLQYTTQHNGEGQPLVDSDRNYGRAAGCAWAR